MVVHIYNSCAGKAEASGFMGLAGQLASHTLEKRAPGQGEAQSQMRNSISGHLWPEHIPRREHAHPHTCVLDTHAHIPLCLKKQAFRFFFVGWCCNLENDWSQDELERYQTGKGLGLVCRVLALCRSSLASRNSHTVPVFLCGWWVLYVVPSDGTQNPSELSANSECLWTPPQHQPSRVLEMRRFRKRGFH